MDFKSDRPIFLQIVDLCHQRILRGEWAAGSRVPSVRELAVELTVNSHTVLKAYDRLQAEDVIVPRRGLGYFLSDDARQRVLCARREQFYATDLRTLFDEMDSLGISIDDIAQRYHQRAKKED